MKEFVKEHINSDDLKDDKLKDLITIMIEVISNCPNYGYNTYQKYSDCWPSIQKFIQPSDINNQNILNDANKYNPGENDMFGHPQYRYNQYGNYDVKNNCDIYNQGTDNWNLLIDDNKESFDWLEKQCNKTITPSGICKYNNASDICSIKEQSDALHSNNESTEPDITNKMHQYIIQDGKVQLKPGVFLDYPNVSGTEKRIISVSGTSNNIIPFCGGRSFTESCSSKTKPNNCGKYMSSREESPGIHPCIWWDNKCETELNVKCLNTDEYFDIYTSGSSESVKNDIECAQGTWYNACKNPIQLANGKPATGIYKPFIQDLDPGYINPKIKKYIDTSSTGYYDNAPLTMPSLDPSVDPNQYDKDSDGLIDADNISNDGILYYNYRGIYGDEGTNPSNQYNNGYATPFATVMTCGTGDFDDGNFKSNVTTKFIALNCSDQEK